MCTVDIKSLEVLSATREETAFPCLSRRLKAARNEAREQSDLLVRPDWVRRTRRPPEKQRRLGSWRLQARSGLGTAQADRQCRRAEGPGRHLSGAQGLVPEIWGEEGRYPVAESPLSIQKSGTQKSLHAYCFWSGQERTQSGSELLQLWNRTRPESGRQGVRQGLQHCCGRDRGPSDSDLPWMPAGDRLNGAQVQEGEQGRDVCPARTLGPLVRTLIF